MPENAGRKQGDRFRPGQSGNTAGLPKGARHSEGKVVERTFAWMVKNHRFVRDYEQLTTVAEPLIRQWTLPPKRFSHTLLAIGTVERVCGGSP